MPQTPPADDLLRRAECIPTTVLSDSLRDLGVTDGVVSPSIGPVTPTSIRTAGWAFTIAGGPPRPGESGPDRPKAAAVDAMRPDQIAVWAGGDVEDVCLFGDLFALAMQHRGVRAAVVDGGVRDSEDIDATGFPLFARYRTPKASTGFWRVHATAVDVTLRGTTGTPVRVSPGDLIVADLDGVIRAPRAVVTDLLTRAEARLEQEVEVRARIESGEDLAVLMEHYGRI
jgi:4-hydroxy-4-methyl-2-oxoglutarate aldolase